MCACSDAGGMFRNKRCDGVCIYIYIRCVGIKVCRVDVRPKKHLRTIKPAGVKTMAAKTVQKPCLKEAAPVPKTHAPLDLFRR